MVILHGDEGYIGKFYPEYHFSYRVAPSQLKKPRGMKSDMRVKFSDIALVFPCNITIIASLVVAIKNQKTNIAQPGYIGKYSPVAYVVKLAIMANL